MIAIIGGTGLYNIEGLEVIDTIDVATEFGSPSASIVKLRDGKGRELLFLPRHGEKHEFLPHEVNYRANIFALKELGVKQILGCSAVGSLREDIHPGEFAIPDQYFDFVRGNRERTFFGDGVAAHVSTAEPVCPNLTAWVLTQAKAMGFKIHTGKTYAGVDGPRLGTKAESHFLRNAGCDLVGMTNVPEAFLAREAQICYATIGVVTDYDCWKEDSSEHVTVADVIARYGASLEKAKQLLMALLATDLAPIDDNYRKSLSSALLTNPQTLSPRRRKWLEVLQR